MSNRLQVGIDFSQKSADLQSAADPGLAPHDLNLFLLNPRRVHWFKKLAVNKRQSSSRAQRPSPPECLPPRVGADKPK